MNSLNKEEKDEEMKTAFGVIESKENQTSETVNEEGSVFKRRGRKGAAQAAQSLGKKTSKLSAINESEMFRVVISRESSDALESVLERCAQGFDSLTITKSDVANYIFQNMSKFFNDSDVTNLRAAYFDEKKMLSSILRSQDDLPDELRKALRAHFGIAGDREKTSSRRRERPDSK